MEHPITISSKRYIYEALVGVVMPTIRRVKFPTYTIVDNPEIKPMKIDFSKLGLFGK